MADEHFQVEEYTEFCATSLEHVDELMLDWVVLAGVRRAAGRDGPRDLSARTSRSSSSSTSAA